MTKIKIINWVLWAAFMLALVASMSHLAYTFGTVERAPAWGWVSALAVDAGLAALAYTIQQRRRVKQRTAVLWWGIAGFAAISALANFYHALSVETTGAVTVDLLMGADWMELAKAVILSATLPAMVVYLGEVISNDDANTLAKQEREEQTRSNREERELRRLELQTTNEQKRLDLEQQRLQVTAQIEQPIAIGVYCERCKNTFKNRQAYAAHACNKNGRAHSNKIIGAPIDLSL